MAGAAWSAVARSPHASGGVPVGGLIPIPNPTFSPREWGCTYCPAPAGSRPHVLPTRVGVYRKSSRLARGSRRSPHASGGVPFMANVGKALFLFSPREWGCTVSAGWLGWQWQVLPTRVGVYLLGSPKPQAKRRSPHASGGVPWDRFARSLEDAFSPREWGCTGDLVAAFPLVMVVPTRVGV